MIRKAKLSDVDKINVLGETLHNNFTKLFHIETEIENKFSIVLVSEDKNEVNGFLYAMDFGDNIDLLSIVVDEKYRGQKKASDLMKYLIENYCYQDKSITLEVAVDNTPAIGLYKKFDFVVENTRKCYYNGVDAYLMRRK